MYSTNLTPRAPSRKPAICKRSPLLVILLAVFAFSCSNTRVTSSWKAGDAPSLDKSNKILVVGIVREKDIRLRMQMEGFLVDALKARGYNAVSAYTLYGPRTFSKSDEESALEQLRSGGINNLLTITLLDKARERNYNPGYGYNPYYPFWGYYNYWYGRIHSPGYSSIDTKFMWESNLYDVQSRKLLYSVQSRSFNPSSAADMGKAYAAKIVGNMTQLGIMEKK